MKDILLAWIAVFQTGILIALLLLLDQGKSKTVPPEKPDIPKPMERPAKIEFDAPQWQPLPPIPDNPEPRPHDVGYRELVADGRYLWMWYTEKGRKFLNLPKDQLFIDVDDLNHTQMLGTAALSNLRVKKDARP